jgi:pimeloyl-ACP methyl ester carboxylesterase
MQMTIFDDVRPTSYAGLAADDFGRSDNRPPLVLLHGLTFDRRMWRAAIAELDAIDPDRRVLAFDLPGHGDSPDSTTYSTEALVERIHSAVEAAGLEKPVIVGHSAAAGTATLYATKHPSRGVVAVEGTFRVGAFAGMAKSLEPMLRGDGFAETWDSVAAYAFRLDEVAPDVREFVLQTSRARQEVVLGYWQALFQLPPEVLDAWVVMGAAAIRQSRVPFVAVVGQDPSPEDAAWIQANLPDARIVVWSGSGHFPHLAHPRRFAAILAETATWDRQEADVLTPIAAVNAG